MLSLFKREIIFNLRNQYLLIMSILLAVLGIILISSAKVNPTLDVDPLALHIASLSSLSIFILPLISLFISHDTVVGEAESNRLILELSYPISRTQWLLAKYLAHCTSMTIITIIGFALAISPLLIAHPITGDGIIAWLRLTVSGILLCAVFVAFGVLTSMSVKQRSTAAAIAIVLWLIFVVIFDLLLLGLLISNYGQSLSSTQVNILLLFNPIDVFRLLSFSHDQINQLATMQSLDSINTLPAKLLIVILISWSLVPLISAIVFFKKKVF